VVQQLRHFRDPTEKVLGRSDFGSLTKQKWSSFEPLAVWIAAVEHRQLLPAPSAFGHDQRVEGSP